MNGGIAMGFGIAWNDDGHQARMTRYKKEIAMSDEMLRRIEQKLDECLKYLRSQPTQTVDYRPLPVDEDDLDGKYGNPKVKFMAKNWKGQDVTGWNFSDCPPEYLDMHAKMLDYFAKKDSQDPVKAKDAIWRAKDASRARGWAERIRKQLSAAVATAPNPFALGNQEPAGFDDADIPF